MSFCPWLSSNTGARDGSVFSADGAAASSRASSSSALERGSVLDLPRRYVLYLILAYLSIM